MVGPPESRAVLSRMKLRSQESSGITGEQLDHRRAAGSQERSGITGEKLDHRRAAGSQESSWITGEQRDHRRAAGSHADVDLKSHGLQQMDFLLVTLACCCFLTTTGETTLTCDLQHFAQRLTCDGGVIVVQQVEASHREAEACVDGVPSDRLEEPLCSSTPVLHSISRRCNGRYRCKVPMDLCHAAVPCLTRCVWMETTYTCEPGRIHYVCQRQKATLYCGPQVIRVLMANYGRTSEKVCRYRAPRSQPPSTTCRLASTLQVMTDRCDGKHVCSVRASNLIFSNPCPGTRKYLKYSYTCVHPGNSEDTT
ncbi:L-rhamnose-binding lectin CSL2-like [Pempheris klunzingeri]|uniref:L-rhamnose-binding lectin CSL2-like n=1 Tax=Pempheris klunzingeri TaxID=3127111 RepID=UPI0039810EDB